MSQGLSNKTPNISYLKASCELLIRIVHKAPQMTYCYYTWGYVTEVEDKLLSLKAPCTPDTRLR